MVRHAYPQVGEDVPYAAAGLRMCVDCNCRLVLWTMRSGDTLKAAVAWYAAHELPLWGINSNPEQHEWTSSPKVYAQLYVDDAALGAPLVTPNTGDRPYVDWRRAMHAIYLRLGSLHGVDVRALNRYRTYVNAVAAGTDAGKQPPSFGSEAERAARRRTAQ